MSDQDIKALSIKPEIKKDSDFLFDYAKNAKIDSVDEAFTAGLKLQRISSVKKQIENQRTEFTRPLNESLKSINAFFKKFSSPLDTADFLIRHKVLDFSKTTKERVFGPIHLRTNQLIKIVDEKKVPSEYLSVDMTKVKKALQDGKAIPGIEVQEEDSISL